MTQTVSPVQAPVHSAVPPPGRSEERPAVSAPASAEPSASFVYAIGRVEPRFASLGIERELAQAVGRIDTAGQTDHEALRSVLTDRSCRYLARHICWVFTVEGLETYILTPRDHEDLDLLVGSVRAEPTGRDVDVVIGMRGPIAVPGRCNGLMIPVVIFDQLYSFDRDELVNEIPRSDGDTDESFRATANELLDRIGQVADNAGSADDHRALNYLAVRYPAIYVKAAEAHAAGSTLSRVEVRPSRLSGARNVLDVIFAYTSRRTDTTEKCFVRVDVTEEFPFLVSKLAPFYERR